MTYFDPLVVHVPIAIHVFVCLLKRDNDVDANEYMISFMRTSKLMEYSCLCLQFDILHKNNSCNFAP